MHKVNVTGGKREEKRREINALKKQRRMRQKCDLQVELVHTSFL